MVWVLLSIIIVLLGLVIWLLYVQSSERCSNLSSHLSASSAHDHSYLKVIESLNQDHSHRESILRGEIQALTEALGRSKEYVPVVYPRDPSVPLEQSDGWFDSRPEVRQIKVSS